MRRQSHSFSVAVLLQHTILRVDSSSTTFVIMSHHTDCSAPCPHRAHEQVRHHTRLSTSLSAHQLHHVVLRQTRRQDVTWTATATPATLRHTITPYVTMLSQRRHARRQGAESPSALFVCLFRSPIRVTIIIITLFFLESSINITN